MLAMLRLPPLSSSSRRGGSFYVQSKVWNAKEALLEEMRRQAARASAANTGAGGSSSGGSGAGDSSRSAAIGLLVVPLYGAGAWAGRRSNDSCEDDAGAGSRRWTDRGAAAADGGADTVGCADGAAVASWGGSQPVLQLELR
jgi:hypothetical protein